MLTYLIGLAVLSGLFVVFCADPVFASPSVTIVIDPGHGGPSEDDDDTNSGCKYHGLEEKNVNLTTALAMYDELTQYGNVNVYITRDVDAEVTLDRRVEFAKEVGADVLISIHYNASAEHNYFGSEIFTSAYGQCYATGHALAEEIMKEWVDEGNTRKDIKTRIGKHGDYYGLIRNGTNTGIPTIILEHGYLDNDRDYQRIKNEDAWREFGIMDATAVARFYGLEKGIVKEEIGPKDEIPVPADPVRSDETAPEGVKLEINEYDSSKGDLEFTLFAYDDESKLMYYGFETGSVDEDTVFPKLELWDGKNGKLKGSFHVPPDYKGKLTAKVYNVYELDSLSNTVDLIPQDEEEEYDEAAGGGDDGDEVRESGTTSVKEKKKTVKEGKTKDSQISKTSKKSKTSGTSKKAKDTDEYEEADEEEDDGWMIGGELPAVETSAIANAIDRNTTSMITDSYTGLLIIALVAAVTLTIAVIIATSLLSERRREQERRKRYRKNRKGRKKDTFDWADYYDKD